MPKTKEELVEQYRTTYKRMLRIHSQGKKRVGEHFSPALHLDRYEFQAITYSEATLKEIEKQLDLSQEDIDKLKEEVRREMNVN